MQVFNPFKKNGQSDLAQPINQINLPAILPHLPRPIANFAAYSLFTFHYSPLQSGINTVFTTCITPLL